MGVFTGIEAEPFTGNDLVLFLDLYQFFRVNMQVIFYLQTEKKNGYFIGDFMKMQKRNSG